MSRKIQNSLSQIFHRLAQPQIFFYALVWLMALLVMGTVAQKYVGLYSSQKIYFSSFIFWFGGIVPAPGGYSVMTLVFANLLAKLATERWTKKKIGTLITHCGALLLLLGGFLTATFSSEGNMVIAEGQSVNYIEDYHRNELAFIDNATGTEIVFDQKDLQPGKQLSSPALPFTITPQTLCQHCTIKRRAEPVSDGKTHGMLVANEMGDSALSPIDEENIPGISFIVSGADDKTDGLYGLFLNMPITQHIETGGKTYIADFRRARAVVPFEVRLIKFTKELYPGTDKPRAYQSEVVLRDGELEWHSLISMNSPLRYKGYTFYQASFIENGQDIRTVLAVVKNIGAIFPYIASITLCLGLLVHLFIRIPSLKIKREK